MATRRSKTAAAASTAASASTPATLSQSAAAALLFSSTAAVAAVRAAADTAQRQELSNLLATGMYHDFSRDVQSKAANLLQLLRAEPPVRMPFSATQLMAMYAQLLGAMVRAAPNKELMQQRARAESARPGASSGSQLDELDAFELEERAELDDELPAAPWGVRDVASCVELLQATQMRLEEALNAEAGTVATTSANGSSGASAAASSAPASAAKPKKAGAASAASSVSADDVIHIENDRIHLTWRLKPVLLRHAKSIVHLMISHFCRPEYWGSMDAAAADPPPSPLHDVQPENANRIQFFYACMQMLVVLLPSVLGQLEAKESTRVMDWLTRIVKNEVARSVRKHERESKSVTVIPASVAAIATPATAAAATSSSPPDSLVRSVLPCCIACSLLSRSPHHRSSFPYGSLSPSGSLAISVLSHAHHLQGLDADNATFFPLLPMHLVAPAKQLTFLVHVANPLIRLHAVSVALANLFNRSRTTLYTGKNAEGLKCFSGARDPLSHEQLKPQLEFVLQWLDSLVGAYAHAADSERRNLTTAVHGLRFVEETATAWTPVPVGPASETRRHKQATAAAEEKASATSAAAAAAAASSSIAEPASKKAKTTKLKEGNVKAMFARETAAQKLAEERSKRSDEENKRRDEEAKAQQVSSQKQAKRQDILTKRDTASHAFRELQSLYANLLALFVQSIAELMHEHYNEHHQKEQSENLDRKEDADALSPHSSDSNPCIPDSQPLTQDSSAASAMDDVQPATPSASQVSLDADDPDEPSASQSTAATAASKATSGSPGKKRKATAHTAAAAAAAASSPSPSKSHKKKTIALPPLPCQCTMIDVCATLKLLDAQVHSKLHAMQAAILVVAL